MRGIAALRVWALCPGLLLGGWATAGAAPETAGAFFFDDFSAVDTSTLAANGWTVRRQRGHPGIADARWDAPGAIALVDDPARPGNRLLRLAAATDGTPQGTSQAQLCHARKYFEGTYAARVRFSDAPVAGPDGDVVVQAFYAIAPLRFDFDPTYSELDWEYLPNGGWGDARTRLYGISWQTVRLDPWLAFNAPHQSFRSMDGWHVLLMQAVGGRTRWFVDGELRAEHGGRNYPAVPMSLNFSLWFAPGGLLAEAGAAPRRYEIDVDWVFHARDLALSPSEALARVGDWRRAGTAHVDTVPAADPPLPSPCDL